MRSIGRRLTYANVISTLALFLVLTGGAAYAARQLTHRSVGTPELKANAVTTAKIKANAVTTRKLKRDAVTGAKIREDAVTTEKLAEEAVTGEKIEAQSTPFGRVIARLRGASSLALSTGFRAYPLTTQTYTQAANELDSFAGELDVSVPAKCTAPRIVTAYVLLDAKDPVKPAQSEIVAIGGLDDEGAGALTGQIELSPNSQRSIVFEPGIATKRTVSLVAEQSCGGGGTITVSSGAVDVIGTR